MLQRHDKLVFGASFVSDLKKNFHCYPIPKNVELQKVSTNKKFLEYLVLHMGLHHILYDNVAHAN